MECPRGKNPTGVGGVAGGTFHAGVEGRSILHSSSR